MTIKFIDELTPGTSYAVIDRKDHIFNADSGKITGDLAKTLTFKEDKTSRSPYVHTTIKRRFLFEDSSGDPVSLQKTHDLLFVELPAAPSSPPATTPLKRQRRGARRS